MICFFGFRIFRFALSVGGFVAGATFFAGVAYTLTEGKDPVVMLIAGISGGIISVLILLYLYSVGIFLLGSIFGIIVASVGFAVFDVEAGYLVYLIPAILFGALTVLLQKFMIILITSFSGAWVTVISGLYLLNSDNNPFNPKFVNNISDIETYRIILSWVALFALGFVSQYIIFPTKKHKVENITNDDNNTGDR
jgi:hypothetical protein